MISYTIEEFNKDVAELCKKIGSDIDSIYGIPRGGVPLAAAISNRLNLPLVSNPTNKTLIVDDLIDSGKTMRPWAMQGYRMAVLHRKPHSPEFINLICAKQIPNQWVEYFWEGAEIPAEDSIIRLLEYIGEDPTRNGLKETPKRVIKSYEELFAGYKQDPKNIFKTFEEEQRFDGLVYLRDIEFHSTCEHHMLSFSGSAMLAYIPNGPVIGVSKLARLLDIFARRLQIQERIAEQVTDALMEHLNPIGAACLIEAKHHCMICRGVKKQNSVMGYNSLKGVFLESSDKGIAARAELMSLWSRK